ncbi:MAG: hypothetical protein A2202_04655 [Bdellovibrionales bacterium RIFOXYA1_FULL_36_14]|nr:MAG: hypothetical protein A2202_04655 [Bdellovibrionales bacterium RIFOXYA1_FULL_36_14]
MKNKTLEIKCPKCKKKFNYYQSEFRPFCSYRCKMIDLGKWLSEEYVISHKDQDDDESDSEISDENKDQ